MVQKKSTDSIDKGKSSADEAKNTNLTGAKRAAGKRSKKKSTHKNSTNQRAKKKVTSQKKATTQKQAAMQKAVQSSVSDPAAVSKENIPAQATATSVDTTSTDKSAKTDTQAKSGRGLAWLALLCSLAALAAGGYAAYQTSINTQVTGSQVSAFDDRLKLLVADQQSLKGSFDGLSQKSEGMNQEVSTELKKTSVDLSSLQSTMSSLQVASDDTIADVKAGLGQSVARWQLDELHALLSHVNQYYQFTGDKIKAIQGLELAQVKLKTISNPHISPVSSALAEDILNLESAQNIDVQALYNSLGGIASLIPKLKFAEDKSQSVTDDQVAQAAASSEEKQAAEGGGFLSVGKALLGDLGNLVQHKNLDAPLKPSLDDSARFIFYESMQLKIQATTVALLRRDNAAYQAQLKQTSEALQANFDSEEANAKTIAAELEAAQAQDISLETSAISKALSALDKVMILEN